MNAEFQWWLLILGIVIGGALVYLVLAELQGDAASEDDDPLGPPADLVETTQPDPSGPSAWGGSEGDDAG